MYGRADGMPSFQLTMAVRVRTVDLTQYDHLSPGSMSTARDLAEYALGKLPA
jgi:hypothetical protein